MIKVPNEPTLMETALYYTFSTIAQTLSGAIALLGALILYRLQSFNNGLDDHARFIRKLYSEEQDLTFLKSFIVKGEYGKFLEYTRSKPVDATDEERSYVTDSQSSIQELLSLKQSLLRSFIVSLILTVSLIAVSVILLSITPALNASSFRTAALCLAMLWLFACLISYVSLLKKSLF